MICAACGLLWDVNDPEPPQCRETLSLIEALRVCRDRFAYYVDYHSQRGDAVKAAVNQRFVDIANAALANSKGAEEIEQLRKDAERLNWLDATNRRFHMGWYAGIAPVGNVMISSVVMGTTDIRSAIDSAKVDQEAKSGD